LALYPSADYTTVSIGKAALRNLAFTLAEELKPQGILSVRLLLPDMLLLALILLLN
jgi:NAD(P)-dependent dehydrogenase (short-subunit alcohol dehydrogenase family)